MHRIDGEIPFLKNKYESKNENRPLTVTKVFFLLS